ncbi:MAG: hypothetical protein KAW02_04060 [candidate division Zixibacteria bacterium]|nr:hypothetical protein [candidate division Zixibacteria bacterium]
MQLRVFILPEAGRLSYSAVAAHLGAAFPVSAGLRNGGVGARFIEPRLLCDCHQRGKPGLLKNLKPPDS